MHRQRHSAVTFSSMKHSHLKYRSGIRGFVFGLFCVSLYLLLKSQLLFRTGKVLSLIGGNFDVCVVGAGLSGSVIAERYATQLGRNVLVLEKRDHIGGNCYDYIDEDTGIRVNKYGAHIFHTKYERVWEYVQQFAEWVPYEHRVVASIGGKFVPVPVNIDTVNSLFDVHIASTEQMSAWLQQEQIRFAAPKNSEQMALSRVGRRLYDLIFKPYTIKQWAKTPAELGPEVLARIPVHLDNDPRYFDDEYQALPRDGYTSMFAEMLAHPLIRVVTNVDFFDIRDTVQCDRTYFTGPIDAYFAHVGLEKLEYRSLNFERRVMHDKEYFQPVAVVNHPSPSVNYTRVVEYKHFLQQASPHTVLFYEYSTADGEPYYPVPNARNKALYTRYQHLAEAENNVVFVGRLANYKYFNMDESILNALELFDRDNPRATADVHIVTNFYHNNGAWMSELCDKLSAVRVLWFVYDKSELHFPITQPRGACITIGMNVTRLPNVGREGHSWLKYMLEPTNIGPINVFLQGSPEASLQAVAKAIYSNTPFQSFYWVSRCTTVQTEDTWINVFLYYLFVVFTNNQDPYLIRPFFSREMKNLTETLGVDTRHFCYSYRGEFIVDGASILRAVRKWGGIMRELIIPALEKENDPPMGHALERMWVTLLTNYSASNPMD